MKSFRLKYRYIVVCIVILIFVSSFSVAYPVTKQKKDLTIQLEFNFEKPTLYKKTIDTQMFTFIEMKDCISNGRVGEPIIPFYPAKILIPLGYKIKNIELTNSNFEKIFCDVKNFPIAPQQEIFPISVNKKTEPLKIKEEVYHSQKPVHKEVFSEKNIGYCKGYKISTVYLYPVNYYPCSGDLLFTDSINIKVEFEKDYSIQNSYFRNNKNDENIILDLVENPETVDTYNSYKNTLGFNCYLSGGLCNSNDTYEYVIITNESLIDTNGYPYNISDLQSHRENYSDMNAISVTVEEIDACQEYWNDSSIFNDTQAHIREFCKDAYHDWDTEYIMILGDWDPDNSHKIVPYRSFKDVQEIYPKKTMASDMYYSHLDTNWLYDESEGIWGGGKDGTNDLYGELSIGRIACSNAQELSNSIYKIINYDTNISYQNEWLRSVSFFGGNLGDDWAATSKEYMEELRLGTDTFRTFTGFEEWNSNKTTLQFDTTEKIYHEDIGNDYLTDYDHSIENDASSLINHLGHTDVNLPLELTNWNLRYNSKPFFAFSQGCLAGRFHDNDKSGCELLICDNQNRHAFGLVLNTGYGYGSSSNTDGPSQYINSFFWDYFLNSTSENQEDWQIGKAMLYAKDKMSSTIDLPSHAWCYAWYSANLFGDPAQSIRLNFTNDPIQIDNENPLNNSIDVDINIGNISCRLFDPNSDEINWNIYSLPDIGNNSGLNSENGVKTVDVNNLSFSTTYEWHVDTFDGDTYTNHTYYFTTRSRYIPNNPSNFSIETISKNQINLTWNMSNRSDFVLIEYNTSNETWEKGQGTEIYNGSDVFYVHRFLEENTTYYYQAWAFNITDSCFSLNNSNLNETTLINQAPISFDEIPENNSYNVDIDLGNVSVFIDDSDDTNFNYSIEGRNISNIQINNSENGIKSANVINPLNFNTTYHWHVNSTDGNISSNKTYFFRTRAPYIPDTPRNFLANSYNRTSINLTWQIDPNNITYIECNNLSSWAKGEGDILFNAIGSNMIHENLSFNTIYYYQIWSYNSTDDVWSVGFNNSNATTDSNTVPNTTLINPENNSNDVSIDLSEISIRINDSDNDSLNYTIKTFPNIGNCSENFKESGVKSLIVSDLSYSETYTIQVNVTDGYNNRNVTFQFTTESRPKTNNNVPSNNYNTMQVTNKKPVAVINGPYAGSVLEEIVFSSAGSYDPDEDELIYNWDFGDNSTDGRINPTHIYQKQGNYTVILTLTDTEDNQDTDQTYVIVEKNKNITYTTNKTDNSTKREGSCDQVCILDKIEEKIFSNKTIGNETINLKIQGVDHYLVDINNNGTFDIFYNTENKNYTNLIYYNKDIILIDIDGDNKWDYKYEIGSNLLSIYQTHLQNENKKESVFDLIIPILIILIILSIILIFLKKFIGIYIRTKNKEKIFDYNDLLKYNKKAYFEKFQESSKLERFVLKNNIRNNSRVIKANIFVPKKIYKELPSKKTFDSIEYDLKLELNNLDYYRGKRDQSSYNKDNYYDFDLAVDKKLKDKKKKQN